MSREPLTSPRPALFAGAVCLTILGGMLTAHAWPLWTGRTVILAVRPVDPRDLFRGEFVRLDTPLTTISIVRPSASSAGDATLVTTVGEWPSGDMRGRVVYVQLEPRPDVPATALGPEYRAVTISVNPVKGALNLRGRVRSVITQDAVRVDYGLDAFFMEEGKPRGIEDAIRAGRRVQMEVAVASSGRARIRNLIVDGTPLRR